MGICSWEPCFRTCEPCLGTSSWELCFGTLPGTLLGNLFLEPLLGNLLLGTFCLGTLLGNLFLGTGTLAWEPEPCLGEPCLGTCSWEPGNIWEPLLGILLEKEIPSWQPGSQPCAIRIWLLRPAPGPLLWLKTPKLTLLGKNAVNYSILCFNVFCGSHAETQKMLQIPILFGPEMHKTLQIPVFLKAKKKHCKLQHFWRVDRKKCWYLHGFCNFKKTWKARNTVNSSVLATFGRQLHFLNRFFCLDERKKTLVFTRFSKNRRS